MASSATPPPVVVRRLPGLTPYAAAVDAMLRFTVGRDAATPDEIWCLEHPPVYTLGLNADPAHVLAAGDIPVVRADRGGQVTYHGPGQLVVYPLLDLARAGLGIRTVVSALENAVIRAAARQGIVAVARREAPGVYVAGAKLASVGLRVRRGCTCHGLAVNVNLDLAPFAGINPCGYPGQAVTRFADLGGTGDVGSGDLDAVAAVVVGEFLGELGLRAAEGFGPPEPR